ncbi:MAG: hypothetical protein AABM40_05790 [Chloroflexota bacterium]
MRQRSRRSSPEILAKIRELAEINPNAAAIRRELAKIYVTEKSLPSERTIRNVVAETRAPEPTDPDAWSPIASDGVDASLVMPVLQAVIAETMGKRWRLTKEQAATIARVRSVASDLAPWNVYVLANAYGASARRGAPPAALDLLVAFAPWRGPRERDLYWQAVEAGAPRLPIVDALLVVPDLFTSPHAPLKITPSGRAQWQVGTPAGKVRKRKAVRNRQTVRRERVRSR